MAEKLSFTSIISKGKEINLDKRVNKAQKQKEKEEELLRKKEEKLKEEAENKNRNQKKKGAHKNLAILNELLKVKEYDARMMGKI